MVANIAPRFPERGDIQWNATVILAANTAKDGTGTVTTVFTADAEDGSWVRSMRFQPAGTNVVTVARIFVNNGASNAVSANNGFLGQLTLPAVTNSEVGAVFVPEFPLNIWLPAGYKLNVTLGTAVAAGYWITVTGGDY